MIGKLFKTEYCVLISIILLLTYFAIIGLVRFITYKISEDNNHTLSKKVYKHLYFIISTYVTMFLALTIVSIWAGLLTSGILSLFFISAIFIQYAFIKKTKDFYRIYEIIKNHECDIHDYIEVDNYKGKIIAFNLYHLELLDNSGNYTYLRGSSITNLVNNSKNVYDVKINVCINNDIKVKDIKELLEKELPSLAKDYPLILEGPNFDGIGAINKDSYTIILSTKTKFEDIDKAKVVIQTKVMEVLSK